MKLLICTFQRDDGTTYDASVSLNDSTAANADQTARRRDQLAALHPGVKLVAHKLVDPTGKQNPLVTIGEADAGSAKHDGAVNLHSIGEEEPPVVKPAGVQNPDATGNAQDQFAGIEQEDDSRPAEELFGEAEGELGEIGVDTPAADAEEVDKPKPGPKGKRK
jgi:hypothetical protein